MWMCFLSAACVLLTASLEAHDWFLSPMLNTAAVWCIVRLSCCFTCLSAQKLKSYFNVSAVCLFFVVVVLSTWLGSRSLVSPLFAKMIK